MTQRSALAAAPGDDISSTLAALAAALPAAFAAQESVAGGPGLRADYWAPEPKGRHGEPWLAFYRGLLAGLRHLAASCDLRRRSNFSRAFWLMSQLSSSRVRLAESLGSPEATVARWAAGTTTPAAAIRRKVLLDAIGHLEKEFTTASVVIGRPVGEDGELLPAPPNSGSGRGEDKMEERA
jgi:hypothetical protein